MNISLVEHILLNPEPVLAITSLLSGVLVLVSRVKIYKNKCNALKTTIVRMKDGISSIEKQDHIRKKLLDKKVLRDLCLTIKECELFISKMCDSGLVIRLLLAFNVDAKYRELMDRMNQLMWIMCIEAICPSVLPQQDVSPTERLNKLINKSDVARKIGESKKLDPDLIQMVTIPSRKVCIKNYVGESALGKIYDGEISGRKIILRDVGDRDINNIKRAAIISNVIRHCDYILRIYGVCEINNCNYIISEYVSHENTLRNILNKNRHLSIRSIVEFSLCIAQALEYIHKCNIIHKDIRTNNIYFTPDGYIKVTGFEMSRSKYNPTVRFANMDTFVKKWWAPEKLLGQGDSFACDVYSFGNLMWELITGQVPFANYMTNEAIYKIISGQRETFPQNTFQPYVDIIFKCWHQNSNQRPSMSEITEMLEKCRNQVLWY